MKKALFIVLLITIGASFNIGVSNSSAFVTTKGFNNGECPNLKVDASDPFSEHTPLKFEAHVDGVDPKKLKFSWLISVGRIESGQGTTSIIVEAKGAQRQGLTATVIIGGLPDECDNEVSGTTEIAKSKSLSDTAPNQSLERRRV